MSGGLRVFTVLASPFWIDHVPTAAALGFLGLLALVFVLLHLSILVRQFRAPGGATLKALVGASTVIVVLGIAAVCVFAIWTILG
jgi:hypothetical protein